MPIKGLDHVNLRAAPPLLKTLRDFYVEVLGLREGARPLPSHGYWLYAEDKAILHLSAERPNEPRPADVRNTFDHIAFACSELTEFIGRLQRLNIEYRLAEPTADGHRQIFLIDPAGNGVELNFPPEAP